MRIILFFAIFMFAASALAGEKEELTLAIKLLQTEMVLMQCQFNEKKTQVKVLEDRLKEITDKEPKPEAEK